MAKKPASGGFNMAAEIRALLKETPALTGKDVFEALKKKFPKRKINEASCGVAYSGARKELGLSSRRPAKRKKTADAGRPASPAAPLDIAALKAAARFVAEIGDADRAIEAIMLVRDLQFDLGR